MRGLPFPAEAVFNREQSLDFASPGPVPVPNGVPPLNEVLPLDPALGGPSSAPAYYPHVNGVNGVNGHGMQQEGIVHQSSPTYLFGQYPQGPEGDPFAPPPHFFPGPSIGSAPDDSVVMSQRPGKRGKRKPRREEECGFCGGNDSKNRDNVPERMVTCTDCGRSGHPSCMDLGSLGDALLSYPWKCNECKTCEVCNEKGDDARILFCDNCDRGWHTYCLNPPLDENPEGSWFCPRCIPQSEPTPPVMDQELQHGQHGPEPQIDPALQMETEAPMEIDPVLRAQSVASTAPSEPLPRSKARMVKSRKSERVRDRKGKGRAVIVSDDDEEEEVEIEALVEEGEEDEENEEMYPIASTPKGRAPLNSRRKSKARIRTTGEPVPDDVESPSPPPRPQKRMRLTVHSLSPPPPPRQRQSGSGRPKMVVKLRIPGKGKGREEEDDDEPKRGMFDDFLDEKERDTSKTAILSGDKERFEKARLLAESKVLPQPAVAPIDLSSIPGPSNGRFPLRSAIHQLQQQQTQALLRASSSVSPTPSTPGPSHANTKYDPSVLRIRTIRFGPYDIQTWYDAPFPEEFSNIPEGRLWICEFCLKYMKSRFGAQRHRLKCKCRHPPGDEIYRDGSVSIFEVDGRKNKIYCQNLCLLSKMFLDHKSLFYDVEPFLFYVMTEVDDAGARFVGYFSKEKRSSKDLNLSCIMTLPVRQRQGWGNLLIDFSYLLSRKEHKCGTPERPLSALGAIGYKKYWTLAIMRYLNNAPSNPRLEDISAATGMTLEDIYVTLTQLGMIIVLEGPSSPVRPSPGRSVKINRSRKNGVARRNLQKARPADEDKASKGPFVPPTNYVVSWEQDDVVQFLETWNSKGYLTLRPEKLKWTPFLLSRADKLATPLEDALTSAPVDVDNTPTTPGPALSDVRDVTAAAAESLATSATAMDVDAVTPAVPVTPSPVSGHEATGDPASPPADQEDQPPPSASEEYLSEPEGSPTPTPSPPPVYSKPRSAKLEALATLACVVSKANPVDLRKRSSSILRPNLDVSRPSWGREGLNGTSREFITPPRLPQIPQMSPVSPLLERHSRAIAAKTENDGMHLHNSLLTSVNNDMSTQRSHLVDHPVVPPEHEHLNGLVSPSSSSPPSSPRVSVEKDAELAARLAREESVQRRSLRSSSNSAAATPALSIRESRPKISTKKRQKAPSVRELSPPTPVSPDRPTTRRQAQAMAIESAKAARMTRRQSSRLAANGVDVETASISSVTSLKRSTRAHATPVPAVTRPLSLSSKAGRNHSSSSPAKRDRPRRGRPPRLQRDPTPSKKEDVAEPVEEEEEDVDAEGEPDVDAEGEVDADMDDFTIPDVSMVEQDTTIVNSGVKPRVNGATGFESSATDDPVQVQSADASLTIAKGQQRRSADLDIPEPNSTVGVLDVLDGPGSSPSGTTKMEVVVEEEDDIDAEGEPDDEDADGEPDPDVFS